MIRVGWVAGFVVACTAAHPSSPVRRPVSIQVVPSQLEIGAGQRAQLVAEVDGADGEPIGGAELSFASNAPDLLQVSREGRAEAAGAPATTSITVASGDLNVNVPVTIEAGPPAHLELVGGDAQVGTVGDDLPDVLKVRVTDAFGNGTPTVAVAFATNAGAMAPARVVTGADGIAESTWTLGATSGEQSATATATTGVVTFGATAKAGPPSSLVLAGEAPDRIAAGTAVPLAIRVADRAGNAASGVPIECKADGGTLSPERLETDVSGLAETRWTAPGHARTSHLTCSAQSGASLSLELVSSSAPPRLTGR